MSNNHSKQKKSELTKSRLADLPMEIIGLIAEQDLETAHNMYYTYRDEFPYLKKVYEKILEKAENALNNLSSYHLYFYNNVLSATSEYKKPDLEELILPFDQIILVFKNSERKYSHKYGFTLKNFLQSIEKIVQNRIVSGQIMTHSLGFKGNAPVIEISLVHLSTH